MGVAPQKKECLNKKKLKFVYRSICRLKISQNQSENYRKMDLARTKCRHKKNTSFSLFLPFYLYISKKSSTFARYLREDARSTLYITQNKHHTQHKTNTE